MGDILQNFGINWFLVAAQIVNFLIIFWLLKKFAYKPIFALLEKRKKIIAEGVENAQKSEEVLQKSLEEEKALLKKAQGNVVEILADAQKQAQEIVSAAEEGAKERVARILADAQKQIEEQTHDAERQLSRHTAELAKKLLEKTLPTLLDNKTQREIVTKVTKRIKV